MKTAYTSHRGERKLILIFAGWAMDAEMFRGVTLSGYDIAAAWDYRTLDLPQHPVDFSSYDEICVVAWSYGVIAAAHILQRGELPSVTRKVAVNGTPFPVHCTKGISPEIFNATHASLSPSSLQKFMMRMCGGKKAFDEFARNLPQRSFDELADELTAIASLPHIEPERTLWDAAYIATADRIFPADAQQRAWQDATTTHLVEGPHLPDFTQLLHSEFISKNLVAKSFRRAETTYSANATPQQQAAAILIDKLSTSLGAEAKLEGEILEIGAGNGTLTKLYTPLTTSSHLMLWDISAIDSSLPGLHRICDAETAIAHVPEESLDLILSANTLQWFNSPTAFLRRAATTLRKGGLIALSTFGPDTFPELGPMRHTRRYADTDQWRKAMPPELEVVEISSSTISVDFDSPRQLMEHLRLTGVNAASHSRPISATRNILTQNLTRLTYQPIFIIVRRAE